MKSENLQILFAYVRIILYLCAIFLAQVKNNKQIIDYG